MQIKTESKLGFFLKKLKKYTMFNMNLILHTNPHHLNARLFTLLPLL